MRSLLLASLVLLATTSAQARTPERNDFANTMRQMGAPVLSGEKLASEIAEAETHPLGSKENPVRVDGPPGERAYLNRLTCENGSAPRIGMRANVGHGRYGTILDAYPLSCGEDGPATNIHMDMYFRGTEDRAPPGFVIDAAPAQAPAEPPKPPAPTT